MTIGPYLALLFVGCSLALSPADVTYVNGRAPDDIKAGPDSNSALFGSSGSIQTKGFSASFNRGHENSNYSLGSPGYVQSNQEQNTSSTSNSTSSFEKTSTTNQPLNENFANTVYPATPRPTPRSQNYAFSSSTPRSEKVVYYSTAAPKTQRIIYDSTLSSAPSNQKIGYYSSSASTAPRSQKYSDGVYYSTGNPSYEFNYLSNNGVQYSTQQYQPTYVSTPSSQVPYGNNYQPVYPGATTERVIPIYEPSQEYNGQSQSNLIPKSTIQVPYVSQRQEVKAHDQDYQSNTNSNQGQNYQPSEYDQSNYEPLPDSIYEGQSKPQIDDNYQGESSYQPEEQGTNFKPQYNQSYQEQSNQSQNNFQPGQSYEGQSGDQRYQGQKNYESGNQGNFLPDQGYQEQSNVQSQSDQSYQTGNQRNFQTGRTNVKSQSDQSYQGQNNYQPRNQGTLQPDQSYQGRTNVKSQSDQSYQGQNNYQPGKQGNLQPGRTNVQSQADQNYQGQNNYQGNFQPDQSYQGQTNIKSQSDQGYQGQSDYQPGNQGPVNPAIVQKKVNVITPVVRKTTYEIRKPAVEKQLFDIEERVIVRPAGTIVVELNGPVSKINKGEVITDIGQGRFAPSKSPEDVGGVLYAQNSPRPEVINKGESGYSTTPQYSPDYDDNNEDDNIRVDAYPGSQYSSTESPQNSQYAATTPRNYPEDRNKISPHMLSVGDPDFNEPPYVKATKNSVQQQSGGSTNNSPANGNLYLGRQVQYVPVVYKNSNRNQEDSAKQVLYTSRDPCEQGHGFVGQQGYVGGNPLYTYFTVQSPDVSFRSYNNNRESRRPTVTLPPPPEEGEVEEIDVNREEFQKGGRLRNYGSYQQQQKSGRLQESRNYNDLLNNNNTNSFNISEGIVGPGERVISATPAPLGVKPASQTVQTRRIVVNHPFETVRVVEEEEQQAKVQEITVNQQVQPARYRSASPAPNAVQLRVVQYGQKPVYQQQYYGSRYPSTNYYRSRK